MVKKIRSSRQIPPPDFVHPMCLFKNPYLIAIRLVFTFVFISWMTIVAILSPTFYWDRALLCVLATILGLGISSHYTDVLQDPEYFKTVIGNFSVSRMRTISGLALLGGVLVGGYMAVKWSIWFIVFVLIEGFIAFSYSAEWPKWGHTRLMVFLGWGFIPALASYYIQALTLDLKAFGLAFFFGFMISGLLDVYEGSKMEAMSKMAVSTLKYWILGSYITAITLILWRVFF